MITKPYLEIFYPSSSTGSYLLDRASHCGFTYANLRPLDPALDIWSNFVKKEKKNPFTSVYIVTVTFFVWIFFRF